MGVPRPTRMRVCERADWAGPQSRALDCKKSLSGKSILLSLKGFGIRKFKPRCKHLQTEVDFFSLCTWNECWTGEAILILSWQCLSLLPKAEIIISSVVTQLLRGVIHSILLYNHSTGFYFCCYWNGKCTQPVLCLVPFQVPTELHVESSKKSKSALAKFLVSWSLPASQKRQEEFQI